MEVGLWSAGRHLGARLGGVEDDVGAEEEEEDVEAHDSGEGNGKVDQEGFLVAEPAQLLVAKPCKQTKLN